MYLGWLMFAGNEIANAARTEAYVRSRLPSFGFRNVYPCAFLSQAIEEATDYTDPVTDDAPWYDPGAPESGDFLGFYPLRASGMLDSTATGQVVEGILSGGSISQMREGTREVTFRGLLIGATEEGMEAGHTWLKSVLAGGQCNGNCDGDDLCFLVACPTTPQAASRVVRKIREVSRIEGPVRIKDTRLHCGGWMAEVEFTLVAGSPYVYSEPELVAAADNAALNTYKAGATIQFSSFNLDVCQIPPSLRQTAPVIDPDCPPLPTPPTMPAPTEACADLPASWNSYVIYVPDDLVDTWKDGVIQLKLVNGNKAMRFVRVRLLPRPLDTQTVEDIDPCAACGDMMISYLPAGGSMTLDGMTERASISVGNRQPISADHLLAGTAGEIPEWPIFACGLGYFVLVEIPVDTSLRSLTLNIANRE